MAAKRITQEGVEALAQLVQHDGGSIHGYNTATVTWLQGQGFIETWRAGYWTATEAGVTALLAARRALEVK